MKFSEVRWNSPGMLLSSEINERTNSLKTAIVYAHFPLFSRYTVGKPVTRVNVMPCTICSKNYIQMLIWNIKDSAWVGRMPRGRNRDPIAERCCVRFRTRPKADGKHAAAKRQSAELRFISLRTCQGSWKERHRGDSEEDPLWAPPPSGSTSERLACLLAGDFRVHASFQNR